MSEPEFPEFTKFPECTGVLHTPNNPAYSKSVGISPLCLTVSQCSNLFAREICCFKHIGNRKSLCKHITGSFHNAFLLSISKTRSLVIFISHNSLIPIKLTLREIRNSCLLSEPRLARIQGFSGLCNVRCNSVKPLIEGRGFNINSLKFQLVCSKIYQKSNLHFICFQIVFCLCQMYIFKSNQRFKLYHNQIFNKKINPASSNLNVSVKNRHFHFSSKIQTSLLHFNFQCSLVNNFLKTISKSAMNLHSTTNNFASNHFILHNPVNPLIGGIVVQTFFRHNNPRGKNWELYRYVTTPSFPISITYKLP